MKLRYHLQQWAQTHRALLIQMARSRPNDRAAVLRIYASLRSLPFPLYQGDERPGHMWDGDPRTGHYSQPPLFTTERRPPGAASRDFVIAQAHGPATFPVALWASGRITQATQKGQIKPEKQREIIPPFFDDRGTRNMAGDAPE